MTKLGEDGGRVGVDRARTLAQSCGAALPAAEAARNLAVLARRAGWHDQAAAIADGLGGRVLLRQHGVGFSAAAVRLHLVSAEHAAGDPEDALDLRELADRLRRAGPGLDGASGRALRSAGAQFSSQGRVRRVKTMPPVSPISWRTPTEPSARTAIVE
ncbi:hypothetical protein GCM10010182_06870 [Actinomadura cremea]|nr:hypothetical protein GCM10010182_06870 [Actinomadura cremea]